MISSSLLSPKHKIAEDGFEPGISDSKIHSLSQNWLLLTRKPHLTICFHPLPLTTMMRTAQGGR